MTAGGRWFPALIALPDRIAPCPRPGEACTARARAQPDGKAPPVADLLLVRGRGEPASPALRSFFSAADRRSRRRASRYAPALPGRGAFRLAAGKAAITAHADLAFPG